MKPFGQHPDDKQPPKAVTTLLEQVDADGGRVLAVYREPVGGHWQAFCLLPLETGRPHPVPAGPLAHPREAPHRGGEEDRPLRGPGRGGVAAPRGLLDAERAPPPHGAREAEGRVGARHPDPEAEVAFQILALNTEKAHNLKEKSLEVIRMYRGLAEEQPKTSEEDWAFQFEAPHFVTLGLLYEENKRFAGGAFAPILKRVDKFLKGTLADDARGARGARGEGQGGGRGPRRGRRGPQEARDQPPLRQELRARAHEPADPGPQDRCPRSTRPSRSSGRRSRASTWQRSATRTSSGRRPSRPRPGSEESEGALGRGLRQGLREPSRAPLGWSALGANAAQVEDEADVQADPGGARGHLDVDRHLDLGGAGSAPAGGRARAPSVSAGTRPGRSFAWVGWSKLLDLLEVHLDIVLGEARQPRSRRRSSSDSSRLETSVLCGRLAASGRPRRLGRRRRRPGAARGPAAADGAA